MDIQVYSCGLLICENRVYHSALGKTGLTDQKREGDGATPIGRFPLRTLFVRRNRVANVETDLPSISIQENDGWSDDPDDPEYNRHVTLPHRYRHEKLFREDHLYDLVVTLGYNDDPPVPGHGSAIFLHVAQDNYAPTEGCVAVSRPDLLEILRRIGPGDAIIINPPPISQPGCARQR